MNFIVNNHIGFWIILFFPILGGLSALFDIFVLHPKDPQEKPRAVAVVAPMPKLDRSYLTLKEPVRLIINYFHPSTFELKTEMHEYRSIHDALSRVKTIKAEGFRVYASSFGIYRIHNGLKSEEIDIDEMDVA